MSKTKMILIAVAAVIVLGGLSLYGFFKLALIPN